ncbi:MAG: hypothetical protein AAF517_23105, partial [Planctomycetota bacterium]
TLQRIQLEEPAPPSRLRPKTPRDLETIALKCLEKDHNHRYPSAKELADDLARFQRGEPVHARPVFVIERAAKWARRRPALSFVLFLAFLGFSGMLWIGVRERQTASELRHYSYEEQIQQVARLIQVRHLDDANEELKALEPSWWHQDLRGFEFGHLSLLLKTPDPIFETKSAKYSERGAFVAWVSSADTVTVAKASTFETVWTIPVHPPVRDLQLLDGAGLLISDENGPRVVDRDRNQVKLGRRQNLRQAVAASRNGDFFALGSSSPPGIAVYDREGQSVTFLELSKTPYYLKFSEDDKYFAAGTVQPVHLDCWEVGSWRSVLHQTLPLVWGDIAFLPGDYLGLCGARNAETGQPRPALELFSLASESRYPTEFDPIERAEESKGYTSLAFSPSRDELIMGTQNGDLIWWDAVTGRRNRTLPSGLSGISRLLWKDGKLLVSGSKKGPLRFGARSTDLAARDVRFVHEDIAWDLRVTSDSQRVITASDHSYAIWKLNRGKEGASATLLGSVPLPFRGAHYARVSPSGDWAVLAESKESSAGIYSLSKGVDAKYTLTERLEIELPPDEELFSAEFLPDDSRLLLCVAEVATGLAVQSELKTWTGKGYLRFFEKNGQGTEASWSFAGETKGDFAPRTLSFDGTMERLAFASHAHPTVHVWNLADQRELTRFDVNGMAMGIAFAPHDKLAVSTSDGFVNIWSLSESRITHRFDSKGGRTDAITFSPDGRRLVTGGDEHDGVIRFWDLFEVGGRPQARTVLELAGHRGKITALSFTPDGRTLISIGGKSGEYGELGVFSSGE